jgi:hypothetical protein
MMYVVRKDLKGSGVYLRDIILASALKEQGKPLKTSRI